MSRLVSSPAFLSCPRLVEVSEDEVLERVMKLSSTSFILRVSAKLEEALLVRLSDLFKPGTRLASCRSFNKF